MCSLVGYVGKRLCRSFVLDGLRRLEYRGYDSAGFACVCPGSSRILYVKSIGQLENLQRKLELNPIDGYVGIGHTKWSPGNVVTEVTALPHFDCNKAVSVVCNGILENRSELKQRLEDLGHVFCSSTDAEIIAHLFESLLVSHVTLKAAVTSLVNKLEGAYAFLVVMQDHPDKMVLVRKSSPLCIGIGDEELFVASDPTAFAGVTAKCMLLPDECFAIISGDLIELYDFMGTSMAVNGPELRFDCNDNELKGHEHYMLKEIYEQPEVIHSTVDFLDQISPMVWDYMGVTRDYVKNLKNIQFFGCGSSWHAASIGRFFFEYITKIPAQCHLASEFRYNPFFPLDNSLFIAVCQSGETIDTLETMRFIASFQLPTIALSNVASSTLVREAGGLLLTQAGYESALGSTKVFTAQLAVMYWLANRIAVEKGLIREKQLLSARNDLLVVAQVLEGCMKNYKIDLAQVIGKKYAQFQNFIFLGRHDSYPFAQEAALKLKETAYVHTFSCPAGELKHGPLALVDARSPVVVFSCQDSLVYHNLVQNIYDVKSRGGHVVAFVFEHQKELRALADQAFIIPEVKPLLGTMAMAGIMQLFVYAIAKELGRPIDQPRSLEAQDSLVS